VNFDFAKNSNVNANINRDMERYREIDFHKTRFSVNGRVNTSRRISFNGSVSRDDESLFTDNP
jgi:hypothetical protein